MITRRFDGRPTPNSPMSPGCGGAGQCAAGTHGAGERVDLTLGLCPYFWTGGFIVRQAIGGIVKLVGPNGIVQSLCVATCLLLEVHVVAIRHRWYHANFGAERAQQVNFFLRLVVRHEDNGVVTPAVAHVHQTNPGVAGCALDDGTAGLECTRLLCCLYHPQSRPVFDRSSGIHEFSFTQNVASGFLRKAIDANEWCIADRPGEAR